VYKEASPLIDILCTRIQTCTGPAVNLRSLETCLNVAIYVHQECIFVTSRQRARARFFFLAVTFAELLRQLGTGRGGLL